mgnify:CR=1 FL=1
MLLNSRRNEPRSLPPLASNTGQRAFAASARPPAQQQRPPAAPQSSLSASRRPRLVVISTPRLDPSSSRPQGSSPAEAPIEQQQQHRWPPTRPCFTARAPRPSRTRALRLPTHPCRTCSTTHSPSSSSARTATPSGATPAPAARSRATFAQTVCSRSPRRASAARRTGATPPSVPRSSRQYRES